MNNIVIYLWTDARGIKKTECHAAYLIRAVRDGVESDVCVSDYMDVSGTPYTAEVKALDRAVSRLKARIPDPVVVKSDMALLREGFYNLVAWKKNNWKNSSGKNISCADNWKRIEEATSGRIRSAESIGKMDPELETMISIEKEKK